MMLVDVSWKYAIFSHSRDIPMAKLDEIANASPMYLFKNSSQSIVVEDSNSRRRLRNAFSRRRASGGHPYFSSSIIIAMDLRPRQESQRLVKMGG